LCKALGQAIYDPQIDPNDFVAVIDNPYMPLLPGTKLVYQSTGSPSEHDEFEVTQNTRVILGVTCIEVHDVVSVAGQVTEDTLDWFAQDVQGNVWYFGENSQQLENGLIVGLEGSWTAGVDGAKPGIVMEAAPAIGDLYRQEFLLTDAEDVAGVLSLNASASVPYGSFSNCLETEEYSPIEPGVVENKFYAAGIGVVLEVDLETGDRTELVSIEMH
jgi:hypothetical protein